MNPRAIIAVARVEAHRQLRGVPLGTATLPFLFAAFWAGRTQTGLVAIAPLAMLFGAAAAWRALRDGTVAAAMLEHVEALDTFAGINLGITVISTATALAGTAAGGYGSGDLAAELGVAGAAALIGTTAGIAISAARLRNWRPGKKAS